MQNKQYQNEFPLLESQSNNSNKSKHVSLDAPHEKKNFTNNKKSKRDSETSSSTSTVNDYTSQSGSLMDVDGLADYDDDNNQGNNSDDNDEDDDDNDGDDNEGDDNEDEDDATSTSNDLSSFGHDFINNNNNNSSSSDSNNYDVNVSGHDPCGKSKKPLNNDQNEKHGSNWTSVVTN